MDAIKSILIGVDLGHGDHFVSDTLSAPNQQAVEQAMWAAEKNGANLVFFSSLDVSAHTQHLIHEDHLKSLTNDVETRAMGVLNRLVDTAKARGICAESRFVYGKSWEEIIREVIRNKHDAVMIGTRSLTGIDRLLLGSTGLKLLRSCPCPVWITRADLDPNVNRILVATNLTDVCQDAIDIAARLAKFKNADLYVLHAIEYPLEAALRHSLSTSTEVDSYRKSVLEEAEAKLKKQLQSPDVLALPRPPLIKLVEKRPDVAILELIDSDEIELLVMATVGRGGLSGFLVGNTVERLLPQLKCSVIATKPKDFHCGVTLD